MKKSMLFILAIACLFANPTFGQYNGQKQDTLSAILENRVKIKVVTNRLKDLKKSQLDSSFRKFHGYFKQLEDSLKKEKLPTQIRYLVDNQTSSLNITNQSINFITTYSIDNKNSVLSQLTNKYAFTIDLDAKTKLYLNMGKLSDMDFVASKNIDTLVAEIIRQDLNPKRNSSKQNEKKPDISRKSNFNLTEIKLNQGMDQIELTIQPELSLIGDKFVPSFNMTLGLQFKTSNLSLLNFKMAYKSYCILDNSQRYKTNVNNFLDLSFGITSNYNIQFGIGGGYLVKRNGDFFDKNTWNMYASYGYKSTWIKFGAFKTGGLSSGKSIPFMGITYGF